MRKIISIIIVGVAISSCATYEVWTNDYRPYTKDGFFLSPQSYYQEANIIGTIMVHKYTFSKEDLISIAKKMAISMGADGICDLKTEVVQNTIYLTGTLIDRGSVRSAFHKANNPPASPLNSKKGFISLSFIDGTKLSLDPGLSAENKMWLFSEAYNILAKDIMGGDNIPLCRQNLDSLKQWCVQEMLVGATYSDKIEELEIALSRFEEK